MNNGRIGGAHTLLISSPSPAWLEWAVCRCSRLSCELAHLLSPHDSTRWPRRAHSLAHAACTLVSPHTPIYPPLSTCSARTRHARSPLVISYQGWGISSTGPPLAKRHAPACRSTAHTAQRSTHALSRPTRLRLSVRHVSDRPRLRPSLLGSARLCSALLASALDASSSHGALLTSLLPLLLLLLLWLLLLLPVCASQRGQRGRRGLSRGSLSFGEPAGAAAAANDSAEPPPRRLLRD